jgi:DNA-binding NarL/FixJ family response regulator
VHGDGRPAAWVSYPVDALVVGQDGRDPILPPPRQPPNLPQAGRVGSGAVVKALVLSATLDRAEIARAVEAGAAGVLHKSAEMEEVVEAVRRLRAGESLVPLEEVVELLRFASSRREQEQEARQAMAKLTPREKDVLQALAEGLDSKEIADRLYISVETERNHMASILAKLEVHSRLQALVFAARHGVVDIR